MAWSWRLGRILGIDVYLHFTFILLLGWVAIIHYYLRQNWGDAIEELLFILSVFGIVLLHEFGHALAARRYGIPTRDITLLPIGGVARLERMPDDPRQELVVALAGPAVNVVAAALLYLWLMMTSAPPTLVGHFAEFSDSLLVRLFHVNVWLVLFNLLPAFPMDGGRVLRAVLALRLNYVQATHIAASVGQGMALLFGFLGLFGNPLLIFIALFVWIGASQESNAVLIKSSLAGIPVSRLMISEFRTLDADAPIEAVARQMGGFQRHFPVVEHDRVIGILSQSDAIAALVTMGNTAQVRDAMTAQTEKAYPAEMIEEILVRMQEKNYQVLPVVSNGCLVGLLTMESIGEYLALHLPQPNASRASGAGARSR